jgi:branched-chain amino acid aminotransferase
MEAKKTAVGFGRVFTPHMVVARWSRASGWTPAEIVPRGTIDLDPAASVLHYGQALFDGFKAFRCDDGALRVFRIDDHLERLQRGGARMAMPEIDAASLKPAILELLRRDGDEAPDDGEGSLYVRPFFFADEAFLGVRPADSYLLLVIISPVGNYYDAGARPLRLWVERHHVRAAPGGLGEVKTAANYAASIAASASAKQRGFDQVLWLDAVERRWLEEVGTMNLFVELDDEIVTPPLGGTILSGITRRSVLQLLREEGHTVRERAIALDELVRASEAGTLRSVFGTGTAAVIAPVGELVGEGLAVGVPGVGDVAPWLHERLTGIQRGRHADVHGWNTVVQ